MMKRSILGAAAALAIFASPANAATNLVENGGFESGMSFSDPYITVSGSGVIDNWDVAGSVDWIGSYWQPEDGTHSIDLAGNSLGTISQTITTVANQWYTLSFYTSLNPDLGTPVRTGTAMVGGVLVPFVYTALGSNSRTDMNWVLNTYTFMATGTSTLLSFAANADAGCCYGPALDSVSVIAAVPEPELWAMLLLGFAAIGLQMRRRERLRTVTA